MHYIKIKSSAYQEDIIMTHIITIIQIYKIKTDKISRRNE